MRPCPLLLRRGFVLHLHHAGPDYLGHGHFRTTLGRVVVTMGKVRVPLLKKAAASVQLDVPNGLSPLGAMSSDSIP